MSEIDIDTTTYEEQSEPSEAEAIFDDVPENAPHRVPVTEQLLLLGVILLLLFGGAITPQVMAFFKHSKDAITANAADSATTSTLITKQATTTAPTFVDPFIDETVTAKAAIVWDINNQKALFAKNENESLPLASVTKLMTTLLAEELLAPSSTVDIGSTAIAQYGDSGLLNGETFSRQKLTDYTLMVSSNDGAYALASAAGELIDPQHPADAFVNAMNVRAKEIGLTGTTYWNPTGLDITTEQPGSVGTPKDMALLMQYIIGHAPSILTYTKKYQSQIYSEDGKYHDARNTNYDVTKIPGLIGSKTGYTDLAGGNLVVAFDAGLNRPVVVVVLGSTEQDRFTDVMRLVKDTETYVAQGK